jgi:hypothetical protein
MRVSKPYDATIKDLAAVGPADFVSWFDGPTTQAVTLLNVDLSTVTTAADVVFGIGDPLAEILHLDAQAGPSATKHRDVLAYNALLHRQYRVPVRSIVLLLREQAVHPNMTGRVQYATRPERGRMDSDSRSSGCGKSPPSSCFAVRWRRRRWPFWASCLNAWFEGRLGSGGPAVGRAARARGNRGPGGSAAGGGVRFDGAAIEEPG